MWHGYIKPLFQFSQWEAVTYLVVGLHLMYLLMLNVDKIEGVISFI